MIGNNTTIGGGGVHHVAMRVKDFDASVHFYTEALGFREWIRWGEADKRAIMLDTGDGSHLELFANGNGQAVEGSYIHLALNTDDCDAALARAVAAGAKVTMEPKTLTIESKPAPTPVRIGFCTGPDGEIIEFFQNMQDRQPSSTSTLDCVSVLPKANVYFDGKVVSHTVMVGPNKKTLGLIYPGTYKFNTGAPERMEITAGTCKVRQAGQDQWIAYAAGSYFDVPGDSSFEISVQEGLAEYICSFLKA